MEYLLGIDIGTSGTKTVLFDTAGHTIASATYPYPMAQPQNGWAEQQPEDWWHATKQGIAQVLQESHIAASAIRGIGLSGQMHSLVMLDANHRVLRPAILWCDGRTTAQCEEIHQRVGKERLMEITANPALPGFTAGKILWVRQHEPEIYQKCRHILLPKDYIRLMLTGIYATDVSDASGTGLLDVPHRCWSNEVLDKLNIEKSWLPQVYESPDITGYITAQASAETGLAQGTPVVAGAGDNAAAAVGTGVVSDGQSFATIGTSGVVFAHTQTLSIDPKGRVHTFCCAVPGAWHVMGVTLAAGASLQWFRNQFCKDLIDKAEQKGIDPYELMTNLANTVPIGSERLLFLPYLMGERTPHLDAHCRGAFVGLSALHTRAHMIRAVLEGVSFSLKDCMRILQEMGVARNQIIACGGGGRSPMWRQMLADVLDVPIATVNSTQGPALGAALLAGVGAGLYPDVPTACATSIQTHAPQSPQASQKYEAFYAIYQNLYPALRESYVALAQL